MGKSAMNREKWAWASYDFANSTFSTSVLSVIFSVYFVRSIVPAEGALIFGHRIPGESLWGYLVSLTMLIVLVAAPGLGARADRQGRKRAALVAWATMGALATMAMFWAAPGRIVFSSVVSLIAILGFEMSLVFYNAFLNDVSSEDERGAVSGLGFALGYVGGGLCLAINLVMLAKPQLFHLANSDGTLPVRASVFLAGAWWLAFSLPAFFLLKDKPAAPPSANAPHSFSQLWQTILDLRGRRDMAWFLASYLIFNDGIQTILLMASIFGAKALGMSASALAGCFLVIQFVAFIGALVAGKVADAYNHKIVVVVTLAAFFGVSVWGAMIQRTWEFWILGVVVGLVMGGAQAASRSLFSLLVPAEKNGEFYGLFSVVGKAASLMGPFVFGLASQAYGIRSAVVVVSVFFLVGGAMLLMVDEKRGRAAALALGPAGNPVR